MRRSRIHHCRSAFLQLLEFRISNTPRDKRHGTRDATLENLPGPRSTVNLPGPRSAVNLPGPREFTVFRSAWRSLWGRGRAPSGPAASYLPHRGPFGTRSDPSHHRGLSEPGRSESPQGATARARRLPTRGPGRPRGRLRRVCVPSKAWHRSVPNKALYRSVPSKAWHRSVSSKAWHRSVQSKAWHRSVPSKAWYRSVSSKT